MISEMDFGEGQIESAEDAEPLGCSCPCYCEPGEDNLSRLATGNGYSDSSSSCS